MVLMNTARLLAGLRLMCSGSLLEAKNPKAALKRRGLNPVNSRLAQRLWIAKVLPPQDISPILAIVIHRWRCVVFDHID